MCEHLIKGGYMGKTLRVNLTDKSYSEENINENMVRDFIGGAGLGINYLFTEVHARTDAMSEENKIIFSVGPLLAVRYPVRAGWRLPQSLL